MSITYKGHNNMVRALSIDPVGQYLLSGSDDMTIKGTKLSQCEIVPPNLGKQRFHTFKKISVWEIRTGRCISTVSVGGIVRCMDWCPNKALSLVAVAADRKLLLINPGVGDILVVKKTDSLLKDAAEQEFTGIYLILVSICHTIVFNLFHI